jgi:hypothetical protein
LVTAALAVVGLVTAALISGWTPGFDRSERSIDPAFTASSPPASGPRDPSEPTAALELARAARKTLDPREWETTRSTPIGRRSIYRCSPPGWNSGSMSRYETRFRHTATEGTDGDLAVTFTVYESEQAARADRQRVAGSQWQACERDRVAYDYDLAADDVRLRLLPPDPRAPGYCWEETWTDRGQTYGDAEWLIFVGRARATITFFYLPSLAFDGRLAIAHDVAASLATAQGLPVPG